MPGTDCHYRYDGPPLCSASTGGNLDTVNWRKIPRYSVFLLFDRVGRTQTLGTPGGNAGNAENVFPSQGPPALHNDSTSRFENLRKRLLDIGNRFCNNLDFVVERIRRYGSHSLADYIFGVHMKTQEVLTFKGRVVLLRIAVGKR